MNEGEVSLHLTETQEDELSTLLYDQKESFSTDKEPWRGIICHEADIILNIERPHPPLLRRPAYPESPKSREALELYIKELLKFCVVRKVCLNEEVEVTKPVIVAWNNRKSSMVGDFRSLNTYTVPDRYPIPKIKIAVTHISQAVYISNIDSLKGSHHNVVSPRARNHFRILVHCGVYEYLRMPFGIKNSPSHFQRMIHEIFPEELSEEWFVVYIDDTIVRYMTWEEHTCRLSRLLGKIQSVKMKIYLKKCHFGFLKLKLVGHVVSCLPNGIDKNKVAEVLLILSPIVKYLFSLLCKSMPYMIK
ncbi:hypothetical protein O181_083398 [Austropuccinia psidii MF-1]|uniref:Reverse transcriptase domain-containing protein n=1 Tax=Austropuccinia psidii MF-1 TaxID=1389203 RepID=A0A9Q3IJI6_9BASI|nr:hypothetical protein [Austropuccinia psidii MF-1]